MFRVLIADDHPLFRAALRQVVEGMFKEFEIFEASTLDEALHVAGDADLDLDAMLLDLRMPGSSGFSGLVALRNAAPSVPIVVVSAATSAEIMRGSITCGASGFIPKSFSKDMIGQAMAKVIRGEVFLPDEPDRVADLHPGMATKLRDRLSTLTQGELRVLELLAKGKSNKIIAYELGIKESTVKAHITAILRKLRVHSRTQAVIAARELDFSS
jgi:DNA-binding NarL/FixJ family response regulator